MGLVLQHQHDRSPVPHIQSLCWQLQYVSEASQRGITKAPFLCNLLSFGDPISDVLMQQIDSHTVTIYHLSLETVVTFFFFFFYLPAGKKISFEKCFFFSCRRVRVINSDNIQYKSTNNINTLCTFMHVRKRCKQCPIFSVIFCKTMFMLVWVQLMHNEHR